MSPEIKLSMTLADFLSIALREGAVMSEVPSNPIRNRPPALIVAVAGNANDILILKNILRTTLRLDESGDGGNLIIAPGEM